MIIGVSGYGATGASAVLGLIEECKDIQSYSYGTEFQLLQQPDGILDLKHYLVNDQRRLSISTSIGRYIRGLNDYKDRALQRETNNRLLSLSYRYIESLTQVKWQGRSAYESADQRHPFDRASLKKINRLISRIGSKFNPKFLWPPDSSRYYSSWTEEEFDRLTVEYLEKVFDASGFVAGKPILLEQLFPPTAPLDGMSFFNEAVSIVVERDPRDLYVLTNHLMDHLARFMPNKGDVDSFILFYKGLHRNRVEDGRVRYVQYEDMIYRYDDTSKDLLDWLGLEIERPRTLFVPEQSINNTCLYRNYPELEGDIIKIEKELGEYLYPFEKLETQGSYERDINKAFVSKPGDTKLRHRK